jgi:hypothetical protein
MRYQKTGNPSKRVLMLDVDLSYLDAELLPELRMIGIGGQKPPTRQRLSHAGK